MENNTIRVLLVDDDANVHDIVGRLLDPVPEIALVATAFDGDASLDAAQTHRPDLILMDVMMPVMNGDQATRAILRVLPHVKILVLSSHHDYEYIKDMLDSGAIGYLVKDALYADLVDTIFSTIKGNTVFSPQVARHVITHQAGTTDDDFGLTDRERQVLTLLGQGQTNAQISQALHISQPTVRFHLNNILHKFGVETRSEALVLAAKNRLI